MSNKLAMYPQVAGSTVAAFGQAPDAADYTVVPLPQDAEQAGIGHSLANVVAAKSKNLAAAQALQSFLAGEEAQRIQSESGVALSAYAGTEDAFVASYPEFDLQVFVDAIDYAVPYPSSRNTAAWAGVESDILAQVWGGTLSVEDATAELAAQMNEALAKE
jgi:multiple sugar transport system substrate-binding protein